MKDVVSSGLMLLWPLMEVSLLVRERLRSGGRAAPGGGAARVWLVAGPAAASAVACRFLGIAPLPFDIEWSLPAAAALVVAGLVVRVTALATLGRLFSVDVAFRPTHELVMRGLYAHVRHPAYTGLLVSFLGVGVVSWSWVGLSLATVPVAAALIRRMRVEEAAMSELFGAEYERYRQSTSRLVPGLY